MRRTCTLIMMLVVGAWTLMAQRPVNVVESTIGRTADSEARIGRVMVLGNNLCMVQIDVEAQKSQSFMAPSVSEGTLLIAGSDTLRLVSVDALKPGTMDVSTTRVDGRSCWADVKPGNVYSCVAVFTGNIGDDVEQLTLTNGGSAGGYELSATVVSSERVPVSEKPRLTKVSASINLREAPDAESRVVRVLSAGTSVIAWPSKAIGGYCPVTVVSSGLQGYVNMQYLLQGELLGDAIESVFQAVRQTGLNTAPRAELYNDSNVAITLEIGSESYSLAPRERRIVELPAGEHTYLVESEAFALPQWGQATLKPGGEYTWSYRKVDHVF